MRGERLHVWADGNHVGVLTVVYILLFPLFQYVIIESCVLRNGLSVRG